MTLNAFDPAVSSDNSAELAMAKSRPISALNSALTSPRTGLAYKYHLRSTSGSNGLVVKESHRFLAASPFKFFGTKTRFLTLNGAGDKKEDPEFSQLLASSTSFDQSGVQQAS